MSGGKITLSAKKKKKTPPFKRDTEGNIILKDNSTISKVEYNKFRNNVYKANKKREKMINEYINSVKDLPVFNGMSKEVYIKELENSGLVPLKQTYSLGKVKNAKDKKRRLGNVNKIANTNYNINRFKKLKKKMYQQLDSRLSINMSRKLKYHLGRLSREELTSIYLMDKELVKEIFYWSGEDDEEFAEYTISRIEVALNKIKKGK